MAQGQEVTSDFGTSIEYSLSGGRTGIHRFFEHGAYIALEPWPETQGSGFQMQWASRLGAAAALKSLIETTDFAGPQGLVGVKGWHIVECGPDEVMDTVRRNSDDIFMFYINGRPYGASWYDRHLAKSEPPIWYTEVGLEVNEPDRDSIRAAIAATAIESIVGTVDETLDQFAAIATELRQA